ncbi:MAG: hypothetical protein IAG13_08285, partial [Deltaproteobacteria bacterium]|nr:hypothetical protein [Nannocystaceae bacterium]
MQRRRVIVWVGLSLGVFAGASLAWSWAWSRHMRQLARSRTSADPGELPECE